MKRFIKNTIREFINEQQINNDENMETLIRKSLDDASAILEKQVPKTKKETKTISIMDVSPLELLSFMKSENIPNDAYFSGSDNGYDGFNDIVLAWDVDGPTTEKEKLEYKRRRFDNIAFTKVYDLLKTNGYI